MCMCKRIVGAYVLFKKVFILGGRGGGSRTTEGISVSGFQASKV